MPREGAYVEADQSVQTAGAPETPDAGAPPAADANPFPWDAAGFGTSPAAVQDAPAPSGGTTGAAPAEAVSKPDSDATTDTPPEGTPAETPSKPEDGSDSKPDAPKPDEAKPESQSRRQAARAEDEAEKARLKALVDEAVAERDAAREAAAQAEADKQALQASRQAALSKRLELTGPEDEYQRRTRIANRMFDPNYTGPTLTNDEAAELARWTATRELQEPFEIAANETASRWVEEQINGQRSAWAQQALTVADEIGLPREALKQPDLGPLLKTTAETVATRIRADEVAPLTEKVSQLETHIKGLETQIAHSVRTPVSGGRSDGGLAPGSGSGWDPSLSWDANFGRETTPAANGTP